MNDCGYIACYLRGQCAGHQEDYPTETPTISFDNGSTQINNYGEFHQESPVAWNNDILPILLIVSTVALILYLLLK